MNRTVNQTETLIFDTTTFLSLPDNVATLEVDQTTANDILSISDIHTSSADNVTNAVSLQHAFTHSTGANESNIIASTDDDTVIAVYINYM